MRSGTFVTAAIVFGVVLAAPKAGDNTAPADTPPADTAPAAPAKVAPAEVAPAPAATADATPADADAGQDDRGWLAASCDEHDNPFGVEPNTPEAWADATDWCKRTGDAIRNAPWPGGFTPVPLP